MQRPNSEDNAPLTPRALTKWVSLLVGLVLLLALLVIPAPYVVRSPGPTKDTLGKINDQNLIDIKGAETYKSTGELRLTTVGVSGGPGFPVNAVQTITSWFDKRHAIAPVESVFPRGATQEELDAQSTADMISSQENATYAALQELDYDIPVTITVQGFSEKSNAKGAIQKGDVLVNVNGQKITYYEDLSTSLADVSPGGNVEVTVLRDGKEEQISFDTVSDSTGEKARLGVFISPDFDFPIDVSIKIDNIGGPSAGTMFALGIMDLLTPEDEANGVSIAGTGTVNTEGTVGAIGGIRQKMFGAMRDGADWFLAPASNCDEVIGHVPTGLRVVKIETLSGAWQAVKDIGAGGGKDLPTCG